MNQTPELLQAARATALQAYAPFSRFRVGAAVSAGGRIFAGCNIENASHGMTMCAERVAIFTAISSGARRVDAIALACIDATEETGHLSRMPCGACRQVLAEFASGDISVLIDGVGETTLAALFPQPFRLDIA